MEKIQGVKMMKMIMTMRIKIKIIKKGKMILQIKIKKVNQKIKIKIKKIKAKVKIKTRKKILKIKMISKMM